MGKKNLRKTITPNKNTNNRKCTYDMTKAEAGGGGKGKVDGGK